MPLTTSDFDYPLEAELIAQQPLAQRDQSRLMVLHRESGQVQHHVFQELPSLLRPGDLLVLNDTRVIPARFFCRRKTGGRIEGLFLTEVATGQWEVLLRNAGRCRQGETLDLEGSAEAEIVLQDSRGEGHWLVGVRPALPAQELLEGAGVTPLPPYIHRPAEAPQAADRTRYQTVYAARSGAVAAPTAGLHFTAPLMEALRRRGVELAFVTLHVGEGTFAPVKQEDPALHKMHREWFDLPASTAERLNAARREGRRVVAVGTTSVRVLETAARRAATGSAGAEFGALCGWTDIFIRPPAEFRAVDALMTNFHLPRSTLLMLVAAFCRPGAADGVRMILDAYAEARRLRYRFYSYGDAMLIE